MMVCDVCGRQGRSDMIRTFSLQLRDPPDEADEYSPEPYFALELQICSPKYTDGCIEKVELLTVQALRTAGVNTRQGSEKPT